MINVEARAACYLVAGIIAVLLVDVLNSYYPFDKENDAFYDRGIPLVG